MKDRLKIVEAILLSQEMLYTIPAHKVHYRSTIVVNLKFYFR